MEPSAPIASHAAGFASPRGGQVCVPCRTRKKRCDKVFPSCASCLKLLLKCTYDSPPVVPKQDSTSALVLSDPLDPLTWSNAAEKQWFLQAASLRRNGSRSITGDTALPSLRTMSFWLGYMSSNILQVPGNALQARTTAPDVLTEILEIIARNGESVPSVVATYSRTVDFWLPIISRETLMHRLNNLSTRPTADLALLLLCLHLLNYLPSQSSQQRAEENADYIVAKGLHSALVSSGFDSLQLVQASLMMALLEYGSGLLEKAQLSIALCSKLGRKMIRQQQQLVGGDGIQDTEEGRLWWSIVVMDRFMSLGSENFDLVTGFPGSDGIDIPTPIDQATSYPSFGNELRTPSGVPIKATPASQFGPFCRTVKSTQVLGRIQQYASRIRGKPFSEEDHMEGKELHELVQSQLSELLRLATSGWEESCSGIGITVASLITLHSHIRQAYITNEWPSHYEQLSILAIQSACRIVIDICRNFNVDIGFIDLPALSAMAPYTTYQAALMHVKFPADEFGSPKWKEDMEAIRRAMNYFSRRWGISSQYLRIIDAEVTAVELRNMVDNESSSPDQSYHEVSPQAENVDAQGL